MSAQELNFKAFLEEIKNFDRIALTAPEGADGDSVGTQCALLKVFSKLFPDKKFFVINEDLCPLRYQVLSLTKSFVQGKDVVASWEKADWPELFICVDGGQSRIGENLSILWANAKKRAQVDHHASAANDRYDFRLYDPQAPATTAIVFQFLKAIGYSLDKEIAEAIYMGLIFDTGMFKHSNTKPETLEMAAKLLETGFNHTEIAEKSMLIRTKGALALAHTLLSRIEYQFEERYVSSVISQDDLKLAKATAEDREGLIDFLFLTPKCAVAVLFFEMAKDKWKLSLRSRQVNVAKIASTISEGGGGHSLASGVTFLGSLSEVQKKAFELIKLSLNSIK